MLRALNLLPVLQKMLGECNLPLTTAAGPGTTAAPIGVSPRPGQSPRPGTEDFFGGDPFFADFRARTGGRPGK